MTGVQTCALPISDDQLDVVKQRGASLGGTRDSTGMGLAIAGDIAEAYGYELVLYRSSLGGFGAKIVMPASVHVVQSAMAQAAE